MELKVTLSAHIGVLHDAPFEIHSLCNGICNSFKAWTSIYLVCCINVSDCVINA